MTSLGYARTTWHSLEKSLDTQLGVCPDISLSSADCLCNDFRSFSVPKGSILYSSMTARMPVQCTAGLADLRGVPD